jgi:hypothetical protein
MLPWLRMRAWLEHRAINLNQTPTSLSLSKGYLFFVNHTQPIERKTILRQAQDERV